MILSQDTQFYQTRVDKVKKSRHHHLITTLLVVKRSEVYTSDFLEYFCRKHTKIHSWLILSQEDMASPLETNQFHQETDCVDCTVERGRNICQGAHIETHLSQYNLHQMFPASSRSQMFRCITFCQDINMRAWILVIVTDCAVCYVVKTDLV